MSMVSFRAMGQYPVSIATSLALEAFMGMDESGNTSPDAPCNKYDALWINLYTVTRNFYNALGVGKREIKIDEFVEGLCAELRLIKQIIPIEVVYYLMDYSDLPRLYPHAEFRTENTPKQELDNHLQESAIRGLLSELKEQPYFEIQRYRTRLGNQVLDQQVAVLTHYAVDLLSAKRFSKMDLLESHTGTIKGESEWYTKYANGRELHRMPFNEKLLQIFGDQVMFKTIPKPKKKLIELAEKYRWTPFTTLSKINMNVDTLKDDWFKAVFRRM